MTSATNHQHDKSEWIRAIEALKEHAFKVTRTLEQSEWLPSMRNMAGHLDLDREARDKELIGYLAKANPAGEAIEPGTVVDERLLGKPGNLWGKLLVHGGINLLVSAPKVGKTALIMHFAGCVLRGEKECLGVAIENPFDHLIIVGPDMQLCQWFALLQREGLADGPRLGDQVTLWDSASCISLSDQGILKIREQCEKHANSLLLIDTLSSSINSLDIDENRSEIARPIIGLRNALAPLRGSITTIVNHHSTKQGQGSSGTSAARGSGALPGACDATLMLNYFRQGIDGIERSDRRLVLSSEGRNGCQSLMAEMIDTDEGVKWVSHGDGNSQRTVEALWEAQDGLTHRQEEAYELASNFRAVDRLIDTTDLSAHLNISKQKALKTLKQLERKGLVIQVKGGSHPNEETKTPSGKPSNQYQAVTEKDILEQKRPQNYLATPFGLSSVGARSIYAANSEDAGSPSVGQLVDVRWKAAKGHWTIGRAIIVEVWPEPGSEGIIVKVQRLTATGEGKGEIHAFTWLDRVRPTSPEAGQTPQPKDPVERHLPNGSWEGGWLIHNCVNLEAITIERLGNPMLRIRNMRWEMDLRAATSPSTPSDDPIPSTGSQDVSEAPTEASEDNRPDWLKF